MKESFYQVTSQHYQIIIFDHKNSKVLLEPFENEKEKLMLMANGDEAAFKIFYDYYWDQIYSTAFAFTKSSEESEEITQDIFLKIWRKRSDLVNINRIESFLYTVARHEIIDRLRTKTFITENEDYLKTYWLESNENPASRLEYKELQQKIERVVVGLPAQQQTAFRLSRFDGLTHEEIANRMGVTKDSVKSYIVRAIVTLKASFSK